MSVLIKRQLWYMWRREVLAISVHVSQFQCLRLPFIYIFIYIYIIKVTDQNYIIDDTKNTNMAVFWDVAPCSLVNIYRCFGRAYSLLHQAKRIFGSKNEKVTGGGGGRN
jgi:hypothetical protein